MSTNITPGTCEVCGGAAVIVLQRHKPIPGCPHCSLPDPDAPLHPRCGQHLSSAWTIDGLTEPQAEPRAATR